MQRTIWTLASTPIPLRSQTLSNRLTPVPSGATTSPCSIESYLWEAANILRGNMDAADLNTGLILMHSGVIGIGLGDTALFASLTRIGEQNTLLIAETLAPFIVITLAFVLLSETLTWLHYAGIFLVLLASDLAIGWRHHNRLDLVAVLFAITAACCQATGALISRYCLSTTELGVLESAVWRLAGGLLFTVVGLGYLRLQKQRITSTGEPAIARLISERAPRRRV